LRRSPNLYRLAWGFYLALAIGGGIWVAARQGDLGLALFFDRQRWWLDVALGLAVGLALVGLWQGARRVLPGAAVLEEHLIQLLQGVAPAETLALAALSGFAEELFFRGAVQGALGLLAATLLFAALHLGPAPAFRLWTLFAAIAGLALGVLMLWRGNLLSPIVAHFVVNAVNLRRLAATPPSPAAPPPDPV
jgi:membrane protease YdiL (CAAX protease family)